MKIENEDKKFIFDEWRNQFGQFYKAKGTSMVRLNEFVLTGIDLKLNTMTTYYQIIVSVHSFHHDDSEVRFYDQQTEYYYSLGQHSKDKAKNDDAERFSDLCNRVKSETAAKENLDINCLIAYYERKPKGMVFMPFYRLEALCVANLYKGERNLPCVN